MATKQFAAAHWIRLPRRFAPRNDNESRFAVRNDNESRFAVRNDNESRFASRNDNKKPNQPDNG
jgi:hypothetical protein